jgi:hypothetical protein
VSRPTLAANRAVPTRQVAAGHWDVANGCEGAFGGRREASRCTAGRRDLAPGDAFLDAPSSPTGPLNGELPQAAGRCQAAGGIRCGTRKTSLAGGGGFQQQMARGSSHNPEVAGSNPAPATKEIPAIAGISSCSGEPRLRLVPYSPPNLTVFFRGSVGGRWRLIGVSPGTERHRAAESGSSSSRYWVLTPEVASWVLSVMDSGRRFNSPRSTRRQLSAVERHLLRVNPDNRPGN